MNMTESQKKLKVLITDSVDEQCVEILKSQGIAVDYRPGLAAGEIMDAIADADALIVRSQTTVSAEILAAGKVLKIVGRAGAGVDNIDVEAATRLGIIVTLQLVDPYEKERILLLRNRMRQNLEEFMNKENIDENRFEQEVIFYLEKIDITEEKVRLEQHCTYFLEQLGSSVVSKGRTLSFISQEMGREINTLGAKAYSADIQKLVVKMKDDLEKIKEQVANAV